MKILYVAMKYDYGDPKRGTSFEHNNFYDSLSRMPEHKVIYFPFDEIMLEKGQDGMNDALLEEVRKEKPDLVFFILFTDEIKEETLKEIRDHSGAITFNWFTDDHWRFFNYSWHWAPFFHWIGTTDSQAPERYKRIGYKNVIKTQWACNHFTYKPALTADGKLPTAYEYDVTFIGQPHSDRKKVVSKIQKAGINIQCWGHGWPNGRISQEDMIKTFSKSKINLNLTKSSGGLALKPLIKIFVKKRTDGSIHFYQPRALLDNFKSFLGQKREQIKGRNFEIPGAGGFLLTSPADNLEDYYIPGKEIAIFTSVQDLIEKIKYYLVHEDERERIREAGYKRTLAEHTYVHRFNEIFRIMGLI
ncbi:MAG: glycosyltransferase [Candidatus Paceibacteria bacterium]